MNPPIFIAHRGESFDAPENTLAAIQLAWQRSAEAVEIDIRLTRDGKIVVFHDETTWRLARKPRKVRNQTLRELKALDIGRHKGVLWIGEKIPTLREALATIPPDKSLFIEIKSGPEILPVLKKDLKQSKIFPHQIKLIGLEFATVVAAKKLLPAYEAVWVADVRSPSKIQKRIALAKQSGLDGLDLTVSKWIEKNLIDQMNRLGL
ncbi:MAG: glycerophosphodiester phosphodiesterase, partial [Desulfobacteraceae bacterium]